MNNQFNNLSIPDPTIEYYCSPVTKSTGFTLLMTLIRSVNEDQEVMLIIEYIIKNNPEEINKQNDAGWTALMIACRNCNSDAMLNCVKLLIKSGANVNLKNNNESSALTLASRNCNGDAMLECIRLLIKSGADVNLQNGDGNNAFLLCCQNCNKYALTLFKLLIDSNINFCLQNLGGIGFNGLMMLCRHPTEHSVEFAKYLITLGLDIDLQQNEKYSALIIGVKNTQKYSLEMLKLLIDSGANVNLQTIDGNTALNVACLHINEYSYKCIELLIQSGADVNLQNANNNTVLIIACCNINEYSYDCIKLLIDSEIDVNLQNADNNTALIIACCNINEYSYKCIELLIQSGADVNLQNANNNTALIIACCYINEHSYECIELLIQSEANLNLLGNKKSSCLVFLCYYKNFNEYAHDCAKLLIESGVNINSRNLSGNTALICACENKYDFAFIKLLIDSGANVSVHNNSGNTSLHHCCSELINHETLAALLFKIFTEPIHNYNIASVQLAISKIDPDIFYNECAKNNINPLTLILKYNKHLYDLQSESVIPGFGVTRTTLFRILCATNAKDSSDLSVSSSNDKLIKMLVQILEALLAKCPALILDKHFELPNNKYTLAIINVLIKYKIEDYDNDDCCFICVLSYRYQLVKSPCKCKILVHLNCLNKIVATNGDICRTCRTDFDCIERENQIYCYPTINAYVNPLTKNYDIVSDDDLAAQFGYAVAYLQSMQLLKIFANLSDGKLEINLDDYDGMFTLNSNGILLADSLYTNFNRHKHAKYYNEVEYVLNNNLEKLNFL